MNTERFVARDFKNNLVVEHRIARRLDRFKSKKVIILSITAILIIYNLITILL